MAMGVSIAQALTFGKLKTIVGPTSQFTFAGFLGWGGKDSAGSLAREQV